MKPRLIATLLLVATLIAACGPSATPAGPTPDVAAIRTSAASTVVSQFTLTAAVFTPVAPIAPTDTPAETLEPDVTATPTTAPVAQVTNAEGTVVTLCDKYAWDPETVDVNIPDNTPMSPGQNFDKVWSIKNSGSCTWDDGYALIYIGGSSPNLDPYNFEFKNSDDFVAGGATADLGLTLTTPCTPGDYEGTWRMRDDRGYYFGTYLTVIVKVTDKCK